MPAVGCGFALAASPTCGCHTQRSWGRSFLRGMLPPLAAAARAVVTASAAAPYWHHALVSHWGPWATPVGSPP
eukprot:1228088-Alexandrium_andersonii.AAC.1